MESLDRFLPQHLLESQARFHQLGNGIPVIDPQNLINLMQRLQQHLSAFEEVVAATQGRQEVYRRRLNENTIK